MEQRVKRLEDDMKDMRADMRAVRDDMSAVKVHLATIAAKLDSKIDYKWMTIYVLGIVAVIMRDEIVGWFK
jgi:hypothetical protein